ncbi:MAG: hypothetical protein AB1896_07265 [Thermodesulfobacteriota bacterium]
MRTMLATHNVLAVSAAAAEDHINEPLAPDVAMLVDLSDVINLARRRETNADEAMGKEEPDVIYDLGGLANGTFNFNKAQPQHVAFLAAFALGSVSTAAAGTGYQHTITPIAGDLDTARSNPSFSAVQRLGNSVAKRLFASCFVDRLTLTWAKDSWLKAAGEITGTGYHQENLVFEEVAGFEDDTSVTLAANAVEGATAAARLDSVHHAEFKASGDNFWQKATVTAASAATPAVLTVTALSASHTAGTWRILYVPDEDTSLDTGSATANPPNDTTGVLTDAGGTMTPDAQIGRWLVMTSGTANGRIWKITDNTATTITCAGINLYAAGVRSGDTYKIVQFGWLPLPALVTETPLRVTALYLYVGGEWNGSAFEGGWQLDAPLREIAWTFQNNLEPEFTPGSGVPDYADRALRSGRTQTVSINQDCRDWLMQQRLSDNETFGVYALCEGPEYEAGHKYQVECIWPMVGLLQADIGVTDKRLTQAPELQVLEHDTYGSVIVKVKNKQAAYAA